VAISLGYRRLLRFARNDIVYMDCYELRELSVFGYMVDEAVIAIVKSYLAGLPAMGIHARRAVLFGSFVQGQAGKYSDIDLIVIAPEFDGSR